MDYYTQVLQKYAVFDGRARRKEFWMFILFNAIASIIVYILGTVSRVYFLGTLYSLAVFLPSLGVSIRRLHDTGRSGWWFLVAFIPLVGWIVLIVFQAIDSQPGDNMYGPNPKGVGSVVTPVTPINPEIHS